MLTAWQKRSIPKDRDPQQWFRRLTDAFNESESELRFGEDDNLDTGNASPEVDAFRPFVDSLVSTLLTHKDPHRRYTQLNAYQEQLDKLALSTQKAFEALGVSNQADAFATLAYGATHAWEATCRRVIQHPGDVILVPTPTYTLLVPAILMAGGTPHYVNIGPNGLLSAEQLESECAIVNSRLMQQWMDNEVMLKLRRFASKAELLLNLDKGSLLQRIPGQSALDERFKAVMEVSVRGIDAFVASQILDLFSLDFSIHSEKLTPIISAEVAPPRAVGLLIVNPTLGGRYYRDTTVQSLAPVVKRFQLIVVEDLAYTLMPLELKHLETMGRFGNCESTSALTVSILGLSKPLSVANHRVSVVTSGKKELIESVDRFIKASVGQVASYLFEAVSDGLSATSELKAYVSNNAQDPSCGYNRKLRIALACLRGTGDGKVCAEVLQSLVRSGVAPSDVAIQSFMKKGVSEYFAVTNEPEGGIFLILDASEALSCLKRAGIAGVSCSYDLSMFLAFMFRIRVIPEELMCGWTVDDVKKSGTLVRTSFSVASATFARCMLELFKFFNEVQTARPATPIVEEVSVPTEGRDLTPAEQSMFVEQMQRAKAYTVVSPARIRGSFTLSNFQAAVSRLVAQHKSLSYTFPFRSSTGRPCCQCSTPPHPVMIELFTTDAMRAFAEQDFDIATGPLSAFRLFRVSENEHILLLVQHHIVTDNSSIGILMADLFRLVGLQDDEMAEALPPVMMNDLASLPWSKHDDVSWHADRLSSLPVPFPMSSDDIASEDLQFFVTSEMHRRLLELAPQQTEFEALMALTGVALQATFPSIESYGILLPANLRLDRASQSLTGFAVNSLVCRVDVGEEAPLIEILDRVGESVRLCREHILAPLPHVAKLLRERHLNRVGEIAIAVRPPPSLPITKPLTQGELEWSQVVLQDVVRVDGTVHATAKHPIGVTFSKVGSDRYSGYIVDVTVQKATPPGTLQRLTSALQAVFRHLSSDLHAADIQSLDDTFLSPLRHRHLLLPHRVFKSLSLSSQQRILWFPDQSASMSSAEVFARVFHLAAFVQEAACKKVLIAVPHCAAFVVAVLGCLCVGVTAVVADVDGKFNVWLQGDVDTVIVVDGMEPNAPRSFVSQRKLILRRDGSMTVNAPSFPRNIEVMLDNVDPQGVALIFEHRQMTHGELRRQCRIWERILLSHAGESGRTMSMHVNTDQPRYFAETVFPILLHLHVCTVPQQEAVRVVTQSYAPSVVFTSSKDVTWLSHHSNGNHVARPIVIGPVQPADLQRISQLFPSEATITVVFTPPQGGLLTAFSEIDVRTIPTESIPMGRCVGGLKVILVRADKSLAIRSGDIGTIAVSTPPNETTGHVTVDGESYFLTNSNGLLNPQYQLAYTGDISTVTLRLTKIGQPPAQAAAPPSESYNEQIVMKLFAKVLQISQHNLKSNSDFFDVGGDSFTLSQLANRLQTHGAKYTIAELINRLLRDMSVRGIASLLPTSQASQGTLHTEATVAPSAAAGRSRSGSTTAVAQLGNASTNASHGEIDWESELL